MNHPRRITPLSQEALYNTETSRAIEAAAIATHPAGALMARAGLSVARLCFALFPHARRIWVVCGPGHNGGDGLLAATHLHQWSRLRAKELQIVVSLAAGEKILPEQTQAALEGARQAGVAFSDSAPVEYDLFVDALLGIGPRRTASGRMQQLLAQLQQCQKPVLCVDVPSDLDADTGASTFDALPATSTNQRHTLSLLTLKPGLFTACGRDRAGQVWLDDLGCTPQGTPTARLFGHGGGAPAKPLHAHAGHKGSYGDVVVLGGQDIAWEGAGMTGAAVLAARASLFAGAGRVFVGLLEPEPTDKPNAVRWDPVCPELMFRAPAQLLSRDMLQRASVVCGCGGGSLVRETMPTVLSVAERLVLDADALNAVAQDSALQALLLHRHRRGWTTVLTPHPLEAARLLASTTEQIMADRLTAAQTMAERFQVVCVLKGSGTVVAAPGETPWINSTGNAALATAGTGDVLAGMLGAALARHRAERSHTALETVAAAVHAHGLQADRWHLHGAGKSGEPHTLTASRLAARL